MNKKATNISALEAATITELPPNTVMISINEEHGDLYTLKVSGPRVLRVRFSDICQRERSKGLVFNPVDTETIKSILEFIEQWNGRDFLIHCGAGVSRSSACAMFLHLYYGYELKPKYWLLSEPNPFVLGRLIIEHLRPKIKD